jgi:hypothetical protein
MSSELEKMVRNICGQKEAAPAPENGLVLHNPFGDDFHEEYVDKMIKDYGLVWCCNCQRFIDTEAHNIDHVFARSSKEIREKTIIEKMAGKLTEE